MAPSSDKLVLCCAARNWSAFIAWLQTIASIFTFLGMLISFLWVSVPVPVLGNAAVKNPGDDSTISAADTLPIVIKAIKTFIALLQFISGIALIQGVNQGNVKKIKVWKVIQIIVLVITFVAAFMDWINDNGFVTNISGIVLTLFCIWVVGVHQKELEAAAEPVAGVGGGMDDDNNLATIQPGIIQSVY